MREWADFAVDEQADGTSVLRLNGRMCVASLGDLDRRVAESGAEPHVIDMSAVTAIDTSGAWLAWRMAHDAEARIIGASAEAHRLMATVAVAHPEAPELPPRPGLLDRLLGEVGERVLRYAQGLWRIIGFMGAMFISSWDLLRAPRRFRGKALIHQMELVGVTALGIIGLMSFLIGITIAQQGAVQLRQFGAEIYTVNLTGRLSLRELGILMTAIMVAGRSGSAFAAQIGTMKLTEEVDAMRTIGVSPMEALIIPRVMAAMLMMPLLGFYSSVVAIIGGAFISALVLDLPFFTFLARIQEVVPIHDVWVGLIKAPVFGLIIGVAGCYHGMQVQSNSEEVGRRTTLAVVAGIFMVIVLDAFFAVFFSEVGWG